MSFNGKCLIPGAQLELYRVNILSPEFKFLFCRSYESISAAGYSVRRENYKIMFRELLPAYETLDDLYIHLCNYYECGLLEHRICVSDVMVIKDDKTCAFYVDSNGFVDVTDIFE